MSSTDTWPEGYSRVVLPQVDSTMAEATRRIPDLTGSVWILALNQTDARGRRGRRWVHPKGNFSATLVMHPAKGPDQGALRSFVASLALFDALVAVSGRAEPFALKWPNDVLMNGGKLAGILLEAAGQGREMRFLSVGIGVNLASAPDASEVEQQALRPVSLVSEVGISVSPEQFLDVLAPAFARYETQLTTYGFGPIREAWMARASRVGEVITARMPDEEVTGVFETIDMSGNIVLATPRGRRSIAAADIFFT